MRYESDKKIKKIYYFAATHWDREWYKTVDEYRFLLVPVMDKILKTLSTDPDFKLFTLDGQTSILEDYLTVRGSGSQEDLLKSLIHDGRLLIGPWYTMPDEFLTSCESLIQNLLYGHTICERYQADPLKTGYVCDTFGHIANFPQILNGFGIKSALISRGTNDDDLDCFFQWSSPDGSDVLTFKAPEVCGYGSFFFEVLSEFAPNYEEHIEEMTEKAIRYVERELTRTSLPYVILMDGMDHETIHEFIPEILARLSAHFDCPVVQERLDDVFKEINKDLPGKPSARTGELTDHCKAYVMHNKLIPHTLSSRYDLKEANDRCQNLLEHYAMPCSAIDTINGTDYLYSYIDYAYSLLLQNHAHDSICGCSIDAVHREMQTRFAKVYHTAKEYFFQFCSREYFRSVQAITEIAEAADADTASPLCIVKIFNPLPYEYKGAIEFDIDFDSDFEIQALPYVKYEQRNSFLILDEDNNTLKYNIIRASRGKNVKQFGGNKRPADTHRVAILSKLRPMGYTAFTIKPFRLPYRITERFSDSAVSCQNDFIKFEIAPNGTITIADKKTGRIYSGLHSFLDSAEMGDGWFHIRPIADRCISSLGCRVSIEKVFDGYVACKFLVRYEYMLPKEKVDSFGFTERSKAYDTCNILSEFTITRDSALVKVHTVIDNNIRDHRLQLHLPTKIDADTYYVNQCNLILNRPTGLDNSHYTWKEADITEYPFESMVYIRSKNPSDPHGFLFLSQGGLHEVSCPGGEENSIDITLLRCFSKTVNTDGEPDGQLQSRQEFHYAIMPLSEETDCELVRIKDQYVSGYKEFTIPLKLTVPSGAVPPSESAFTFSSDACAYLTCMPSRKDTSSIIIRAVNYSGTPSPCTIHFAKAVETAYLCNFLEKETGSVHVEVGEDGKSGSIRAEADEERKTGCVHAEANEEGTGSVHADANEIVVMVPPYKMVNIKVHF